MAGQRRELARADAGLADAAAAAAALQGGHVALQAAVVNELKVHTPAVGLAGGKPVFLPVQQSPVCPTFCVHDCIPSSTRIMVWRQPHGNARRRRHSMVKVLEQL